jgi:hypothetical protein
MITPEEIVQATRVLKFAMYAVDPEIAMAYGATKVPADPVKGVEHAEMLKPEIVQDTTELPVEPLPELTTNALLPEIAMPAG